MQYDMILMKKLKDFRPSRARSRTLLSRLYLERKNDGDLIFLINERYMVVQLISIQ